MRRLVQSVFVGDISCYEFDFTLDLGRGFASVHQLVTVGDARALMPEQRTGNAQWRTSGLVLS